MSTTLQPVAEYFPAEVKVSCDVYQRINRLVKLRTKGRFSVGFYRNNDDPNGYQINIHGNITKLDEVYRLREYIQGIADALSWK